jgi:large subunit ribosomal protein L24
MKIKEKDNVLITTGKDRGKTGKVEKVMKKTHHVVVAGLNIQKKHSRPTKKNPKGGIVSLPAPIDISNVAFICPKCNKKTKIGYKMIAKRKERICKSCREQI